MVIKVGINGFGRIGRIIARSCLKNSNLQLAAINDPAITAEYICYLLKFDSTHGKLKSCISHVGNLITIDDTQIKVFHENLPASIPWHIAGVQYVVESSGMFTNLEKASGHLASDGVKRVIVTAPSVDIPMVILGVNDGTLTAGQKVISCASSTLYCLAPIIKILEDNFGVSEGFITSIHAMTPSLKPLDGLCLRGKHWRDHRSIHQNIIPAATGACKALGKIIPQMKDKLSGLAFRVPIVNVSVLDLSLRLCMNTTLQEIVKTVEKASQFNMANIIKVTSEELVSSDFMGEHCSCMFDSDSSIQLKPNFYKIICWYENENSYACRVVDSIFFSEKQLFHLEFPSKLTNVRIKSVCKRDEILQTDPNKLQSSVAVHCDFGITSRNTSSDTYASNAHKSKSAPRQVCLKKPVAQSGSFPEYKNSVKNDYFKIWNDNDTARPAVKQNRESFFHSCTTFSPQERLDSVKKEFSKMVNITEDLLKKTQSSQSQNKVLEKDEFKLYVVTSLNKDKRDEPLNPLVNLCGDCENNKINQAKSNQSYLCKDSLNKLNVTSKLDEIETPDKEIKSVNLCGDSKIKKPNHTNFALKVNTKLDEESKPIQQNSSTESRNKIKIEEELCHNVDIVKPGSNNNQIDIKDVEKESSIIKCLDDDRIDTRSNNIDLINRLADTVVSSLLDSFHETHQVQCVSVKTNKQNYIENMPESNQHDTKQPQNDDAKSETVIEYPKSGNEICLKLIDEELKKRNIVLVDNPFATEADSGVDITNQSPGPKPTNSREQIRCEGLDGFSSESVILSEEKFRYDCSKNLVLTANCEYNKKQDIYDKLDSASGSDSNNSFDIHDKKSQIIHITDLTNSLEDLARLDKICRIIEISDELSDKLFSPLKHADGSSLEKEKWSFKDLCDRIKLDDFCNKVFGHR